MANFDDSEARVVMSEYLANYKGEPILFNMSGEDLRDLFFDVDEKGEYVFALSPEFIEFIDFSNIPVDEKVKQKLKRKKGNKGE